MKSVYKTAFSKLLVCSTALAILVAASGCGLKKKKDEDKAKQEADKAQKVAQATVANTEELEAKKIAVVQADIVERVRIYEGMSGSFHGSYLGVTGQQIEMKVRITTANIPAELKQNRPISAGDMLDRMNAISLIIEIDEVLSRSKRMIGRCSETGTKPDYKSGTIRLTSMKCSFSTSREYIIALDTDDTEFAARDIDSGKARFEQASKDLTDNKIASIDAMTISVIAPEGNHNGKVWRDIKK